MTARTIGIAALGIVGSAIVLLTSQARDHVAAARFWFEDVTFDSSEVQADRLGGGITAEEMRRIRSLAWSELRTAYAGLRISFTERRHAPYQVAVVQDLRPSPPYHRYPGPAGLSRVVTPFGGRGAVSFRLLAGNAIVYAAPHANRATMIDAIGRGVGRAAVHEFAHQFLKSDRIHASKDTESYEYGSADRAAQYYRPLHWDIAWPLLEKRFGPVTSVSVTSEPDK